MNEIAAKLGEVGLPAPVSELAARDWDAIIVGGGHNGLTAAAYLARAGRSVLVLERRERLGGACTLERPFADERFVISPCAYVLGLLDQLVIDDLDLHRRGLRWWIADPNLWIPFADGSSLGQFVDDSRTQANLEALGVSKADIDGYWKHQQLYDDIRKLLRKGERDAWEGETPTRAEIEEMLGGNQAMIDLVFEASIAEVMDDYFRDQRLHDAFFGGGVIGTWAGPRDKGTASVKLMHHQGDLDGGGSNWAYVEGGMGMVSFAIADAAREAGAMLACGVPVAVDHARRGRRARGRDQDPGERRDLERRPEGGDAPDREGGDRLVRPRLSASGSTPGTCAVRSSSSTPPSTSSRTGRRPQARAGRPAR